MGHSTLKLRANCVRTGCHEEVSFDPRSPALYCSTGCRVAAARDQKWLKSEAARLRGILETAGDVGDQEEARERLKVVLWHLGRYAPAGVRDSGP